MATTKDNVKPTLLSTKDEFMRDDRKVFKSTVNLGVLWMAQKSNWFLLSILQHVLWMGFQTQE